MKTYCFYDKNNVNSLAAAALVNIYEKGKLELISSVDPDPEIFHDCKIYILGRDVSRNILEALHMTNRVYWFDSPNEADYKLSYIPGFRHPNPDITIWWLAATFLYPSSLVTLKLNPGDEYLSPENNKWNELFKITNNNEHAKTST